jgi:twitching motility protein PilT
VSDRDAILGLLRDMVPREASDLHLVPGHAPTYRVHGELQALRSEPLEAVTVASMLDAIVPDPVRRRIADSKDVDFSIATDQNGTPCRYRANVGYAQGQISACFRHVPNNIPTFEWMGFPRGLAERLVNLTNGLVIITGITGSGKTTSLAALINLLNDIGGYRIITIEEPIEFVYPKNERSVITQREVGVDVDSFYDGLKYGLRQDPDVLLVGEIRDRETAAMALSAAETGHLIFATMHTRDAKGAITRFVDLFPHVAQDDVRTQLALSLRCVVSQHLLPSVREGEKRALALEVMHVNHPVRIGIRFGKIESIESAIQTGRKDGLISLDESLQQLVSAGRISIETARRHAKDPDSFR